MYGKTTSTGRVLVAPIKEIVRIPKDTPLPLGAKRKRGSTRPRSRSRALPEEEVIPPALAVVNPEEGWDDETTTVYTVLRYTDREEAERRRSSVFQFVSISYFASQALRILPGCLIQNWLQTAVGSSTRYFQTTNSSPRDNSSYHLPVANRVKLPRTTHM